MAAGAIRRFTRGIRLHQPLGQSGDGEIPEPLRIVLNCHRTYKLRSLDQAVALAQAGALPQRLLWGTRDEDPQHLTPMFKNSHARHQHDSGKTLLAFAIGHVGVMPETAAILTGLAEFAWRSMLQLAAELQREGAERLISLERSNGPSPQK
jgi:hypothetical protein